MQATRNATTTSDGKMANCVTKPPVSGGRTAVPEYTNSDLHSSQDGRNGELMIYDLHHANGNGAQAPESCIVQNSTRPSNVKNETKATSLGKKGDGQGGSRLKTLLSTLQPIHCQKMAKLPSTPLNEDETFTSRQNVGPSDLQLAAVCSMLAWLAFHPSPMEEDGGKNDGASRTRGSTMSLSSTTPPSEYSTAYEVDQSSFPASAGMQAIDPALQQTLARENSRRRMHGQ